MTPQDYILAVGGFIFVLALVPMLFDASKPALTTSLTTGTTLAVFAGVYLSLGLLLATITTGLSALLWLILAYQRCRA